ncbi:hypothetical protein PHYBLDRAFT_176274 [Phycomyces blakesleeanus NRRL 1555(-)]|uniref:Uncharacterized protein n=1 Tax=Phycomyces blakesleeanus (strain ATCC 8743b / DSM 1359 / FGSC 10004 / NBRC 33097 / NRRL 1555) TaxID=763407 RepID=A0A162N319_PHYB8|nr:hypothetical protein PHYBLDRAFT_176274 [Phycomyces blakesleeanus NRRL 1555(-)]OAD65364.1 hypothetical protein PHYBLDRAFT_176274 [Phycomyces blakesleeanus NRRL 1555(-)]|eukprot:XP_018283404.1 hypothetical protein PHYBLDRAFT_176274 [Phycomyces blakesleeanus NRRL 1555(-)]
MFAIANPNEVCYKYTRCNRNPLRYITTDKRTAKLLTAKVNTGETDMDIDQIEEYIEDDNHSVGAPSPEQYVHTDLPLLVEESLFGTEEYTSEYESEYELSDDIEPEEQDREEEQESTANLPENSWYRVIAIFTMIFILTFIVDDGAVILITFINTILEHYVEDFKLPISIPGLKHCKRPLILVPENLQKFYYNFRFLIFSNNFYFFLL